MPSVTIRAFEPADLPAVRSLIDAEAARHPYGERATELIGAVTPHGEYHAVVAEHDEATVGVALYGIVAGTDGAGAVYAVVVDPSRRREGTGGTLISAAIGSLVELGARFAIAELPDDPAVGPGVVALFSASGFVETARVTDLYRDGVALTFWQRPL